MCGFVGYLDNKNAYADERIIRAMTDMLYHRGPDDSGVWQDVDAGIALGHRRLAVVDLSVHGQQPMFSQDGRWVLVYNGEIYNFREIRRDLEAHNISFRGHSDTEVIVAAIAHWGVTVTLKKLAGMFAFAVWDTVNRELFLARDPIGIKPLYWGKLGSTYFFGSELKAFKPHPAWQPEIDRDCAAAYMRYGYVSGEQSIWKGVERLSPGHVLRIQLRDFKVRLESYWSWEDTIRKAHAKPWQGSEAEAIDALHDLLKNSVASQMLADVPLGAFLSGGVDSSTVVALMSAQASRQVKTFSIGFDVDGYNEAPHARAVAAHLGTDHTELYVTPQDALNAMPQLSEWYDEPFADSSQIPTYLVSQLARQQVTVSLSGDGGDELFAGYSRYDYLLRAHAWQQRFPAIVRRCMEVGVALTPQRILDMGARVIPGFAEVKGFGAKVKRQIKPWSRDSLALYLGTLGHWQFPESVVVGAYEPQPFPVSEKVRQMSPDMLQKMQYIDSKLYLPDDILTKVDRSSMAVSLETRVPLLDHRIAEFAWRLPNHFKRREGVSKWILREVLYKYVPRHLIERPKKGFAVPIDSWLRAELKDWSWSLLNPEAIAKHDILQAEPMGRAWQVHQAHEENLQYPLWTALMLQNWLDKEAAYKKPKL